MRNKIIAISLFIILVFFIIYFPRITDKIYKFSPDVKNKSSYNGVITIADTVKRTVAGAQFGFMNKVIYNYETAYPDVRTELRELKYGDNSEIAVKMSSSDNHPDIMTYYINNICIDNKYIYSSDFYLPYADDLSEYFASGLKNNSYNALPVSYEVPAVLINTDLLKQLNIDIPKEINRDNFFTLLTSIDSALGNDKIYSLDLYISKNNNIWEPFYINGDMSKITSLKHIRPNLLNVENDNVISSFADSKSAICVVPVSQMRTLQNIKDKGGSTSFSVYALPYETTYISNISFYAAFKTDNLLKQYAIFSFLKNLLSDNTQLMLQDIMHLPVKDVAYDKYTYLNNLKYRKKCVLLDLDSENINKCYNEMIQNIH
ncbi:MAG: extracellular solute-binding protein [Eubacteriaceae bacterium]|nr:extracellular solute-binding protein [Eubacteriaceae bacterium]